MLALLLTPLFVTSTMFMPEAGLAVATQAAAAPAAVSPASSQEDANAPVTNSQVPPRNGDMLQAVRQKPVLWGRSLALGGSFGAGAPLGVAGVFAELNPTRTQAVSWGGGYGGFGVTWAAMFTQRFLLIDDAAYAVRAGYSMSITPSSYRESPELSVPAASHWLNLEVGREWRFAGVRTLRVGVGHAFALNGGSFRCSDTGLGACSAASESNVPGWAPYGGGRVNPEQAAIAHAAGESLHMWYVHIDFGALIGF